MGIQAKRESGFVLLALFLLAVAGLSARFSSQDIQVILDQADKDLQSGRIAQSVAGFDEVIKRSPEHAPYLWQRGIALYYAGRYKDCQLQFESHRSVNPADVENAAWHFLCVAKGSSVSAARAALLPVGVDRRTAMREVYEMFRGRLTPDQVMAAAEDDPTGLFYANLYVGLFYDVTGDAARTRQYIAAAADEKYRRLGGYMHSVARVHLGTLKK